jgi:hypothetical protein
VGWQPSSFLTGQAEAEHAFALAERLGSVYTAAAEELGCHLAVAAQILNLPQTPHARPQPRGRPAARREAARRAAAGHPPLDPCLWPSIRVPSRPENDLR